MKSVEKELIKQYFTSGSRPTQQHFHKLVDGCYNETRSAFVSGYQVTSDMNNELTLKSIRRTGGQTFLVPAFRRINTSEPHSMTFHYSIPLCNIGTNQTLSGILFDLVLPRSMSYDVHDNDKIIRITQQINLVSIKIHNGSEELHSVSEPGLTEGLNEIELNTSTDRWMGIGIDIDIIYDIKSDRAVSDDFDITRDNEHRLEHVFGSAGCIFE